jgi:hypothetical protein
VTVGYVLASPWVGQGYSDRQRKTSEYESQSGVEISAQFERRTVAVSVKPIGQDALGW